jgi:hypothetical protein
MKAVTTVKDAVVRAALAWNDFWFTPSNPTTLGLIRILAGALVLYAHVAYSYDFQAFFGKDGWRSLAGANLERRTLPQPAPPIGWDAERPALPLPPGRKERERIIDYLRSLPDEPAERARLIALFKMPRLPQKVGDLPTASADRKRAVELLKLRDVPNDSEAPIVIDWGRHEPPEIFLPIRNQAAPFLEGLPPDHAERERIFTFMKDWSRDPRQVAHGTTIWSVWFHVSDPTWMLVIHCLILTVMFLFTAGLCTRVTAVLTWLAALSYIQRSPITFFGADAVMMVLLLYLMIGPSGAALSVDRLIGRWWAERRARRAGKPLPEWPAPAPSISANFTLRLMQIHFCIIYLAAGTSKLLGGRWWNGHALYYSVANYEFSPLDSQLFHGLLAWLCQHRWLWEIVFTSGTWFTVALELSLPLLVWNRKLRMPYVLCAVTLHTAIAATMGLVVFSLLMATMVIAFVPGETVQALLDRLRRLSRHLKKAPEDVAKAVQEPEAEARPAKKSDLHGRARHGSRR